MVTYIVVVDVGTLAIEVLSDGDQIADGGGRADTREELSTRSFQANLLQGLQSLLHNLDLRLEVLIIGLVLKTMLYVDWWIDQRPVPKIGVLFTGGRAVDQTGAKPRSEPT